MSKLLKEVKSNPHFELLGNGKIRCILTNHDIMPDLESFHKYLESKSYQMGLESAHDFEQYKPNIVEHKKDKNFLYCNLTGQKLIKRKTIIEKHVNGKRFLKLKKLWEEEQEKKKAKQDIKKKNRKIRNGEKVEADEDEEDEKFDSDNIDQIIAQIDGSQVDEEEEIDQELEQELEEDKIEEETKGKDKKPKFQQKGNKQNPQVVNKKSQKNQKQNFKQKEQQKPQKQQQSNQKTQIKEEVKNQKINNKQVQSNGNGLVTKKIKKQPKRN